MLLWYQETLTLQLQPTQLCFLLDDLVRKLEHSLLATAGKRRCFLKVSEDRGLNISPFYFYFLLMRISIARGIMYFASTPLLSLPSTSVWEAHGWMDLKRIWNVLVCPERMHLSDRNKWGWRLGESSTVVHLKGCCWTSNVCLQLSNFKLSLATAF